MEPGKLPPDLLARLLAKVPAMDNRVLLGAGVGEDAAVISFGNSLLVAKTDPITFAVDNIGWYAINVNANDVAATGARPAWFLATALIPQTWQESQVEELFDQLLAAARELDIALVGGHTEITLGIDRPLICGCMLGEVGPQGIVRTGGAQLGDTIILTKGIAIEGTALLAREAAEPLRQRGVPEDLIRRARSLLFDPGISVVKEATLACQTVPIHSMHDPTEGGLATALREVGIASHTGIRLEEGAVAVLPETAAICDALGLEPLGMLASGSLLITLPPENADKLLAVLRQSGIAANAIGAVTPAADGYKLCGVDGLLRDLPTFARDEIARFFSFGPR